MTRPPYTPDPAKKVAIVGFASSTRNDAPFQDPSFEVWGLNSLYALIPRFDRWFEIHPRQHIARDLNRAELQQIGVEHVSWLKAQPGPGADGFKPIYMQDHYDDIPASVRWPREEINAWSKAMIGTDLLVDYFTSTPGQMVATAVYEGYGEIHLYGVDLLQDEEYAYQRPGCEAWAALGAGLGCKILIPKASALFRANYVYGYTEPLVEFGAMTPLVNFTKIKSEQAQKGQQQILALLNQLSGARQVWDVARKKLAEEGVTLESFLKFLNEHDAGLANRLTQGNGEIMKVGGQAEVLASMVSWIAHFGRGGTLEGM